MTDSVPTAGEQTAHEKQAEVPTQSAQDASSSPLVGALENAVATTSKPDDQGGGDYPSGLPLSFIVLALILSIFLASLDLVCWTNALSLP